MKKLCRIGFRHSFFIYPTCAENSAPPNRYYSGTAVRMVTNSSAAVGWMPMV